MGKRVRPSTIGFGLASHWLRKWCELCQPIMSLVKKNQSKQKITFNTQVKTALTVGHWTLSNQIFICKMFD